MKRQYRWHYTVLTLFMKELKSLWHDKILLLLILWAFTGAIYAAASATSRELHNAPIAIVDEDHSQLAKKISDAFYQPYFQPPVSIKWDEIDQGMDKGSYTFVLCIPSGFERDLLAGRNPALQINIDATRVSQAFIGNNYIANIIRGELLDFLGGRVSSVKQPITLVPHYVYNPNLTGIWFSSIMELISNVTMLSIILTGAAIIREREHGTLEHLLAMPVRPVEIVAAKILANGGIVLVAVLLSLLLVIHGLLGVPIHGSIPLFITGTALHLFATTSMGIFLGTTARSMPQLGLLLIMTILPLHMLSGSITPRESMPEWVQQVMLAAPTTHFVDFAQAILYRGAGLTIVWPRFLLLIIIGLLFFVSATAKFRHSVTVR